MQIVDQCKQDCFKILTRNQIYILIMKYNKEKCEAKIQPIVRVSNALTTEIACDELSSTPFYLQYIDNTLNTGITDAHGAGICIRELYSKAIILFAFLRCHCCRVLCINK